MSPGSFITAVVVVFKLTPGVDPAGYGRLETESGRVVVGGRGQTL